MVTGNSKRIAINTLIMYARMLFVMVITLYTVRVLLRVLGIEDYGIYNVVVGFVSMLAVVSNTMETATQRYYSFAIGKNEKNGTNHVFCLSISIYILICIVVVLFAETVGLWFVNKQLKVPSNRIFATNWIYQFAIFSFAFSMISIPFSSLVIAHEDMSVYATISVLDCILKLLIVYAISLFSSDNLITYGILSLLVIITKVLIFIIWCRIRYIECHYRLYWNRQLFKSMISYSGWTLFGAAAGVANNQGNNVLINIFFGPVANAARSVAFQVSNAITAFCSNLFVVIRPPMVKSYAEKNIDYMMRLFYLSSKFIYFLLYLLFLPIFLETEYILHIWLGETGKYMVIFTRLTLVYSLILAQHNPITTIIQATGRVKIYFSIVESVTLLSLPLSYLFFKIGYSAESTFYISIIVFLFAHILRLYILRIVITFSMKEYLNKFIIPALLVSVISSIMPVFFYFNMGFGYKRFLIIIFTSIISVTISSFIIGLNKSERNRLYKDVHKQLMNQGLIK